MWIGIGFVLRLWWAIIVPFNDSPDEARHLRTLQFFSEHGLPSREDILSGQHGYYIATSPLPYAGYIAIDAAFMRVAKQHPPLIVLRLLSVLLGTALIALAAWVMRRVEPSLAAPMAALFALHPQLCFQSAYVNWDILTFVIGAAVVATWPALLEGRIEPVRVGAAAGACLLAKATGFAVLVPLLGVFLYAHRAQRAALVKNALLAGGVCAAIALPFLMHNEHLLPGDPFGFNTVLGRTAPDWEASVPGGWWQLFTTRWLINSFESSWAVYGYLGHKVWNGFYVAFALLSCTALFGLVRQRLKPFWIAAVVSVGASTVLSYATSAINDYQPYGRYLFPSAIPLFGLFVLGCSRVHERVLLGGIALCALVTMVTLFSGG